MNARKRTHNQKNVPRLAVDVVFVVVIDAPPIAARALKLIVDIVIIVVECDGAAPSAGLVRAIGRSGDRDRWERWVRG